MNKFDRLFQFQKINPKTGKVKKSIEGNSLLHVAIQQVDLKIVIFLLVNRLLNIYTENFQNQTPLQLAQLQMRKHYVKSILIIKLIRNSQICQLKMLEESYVQTDENESSPLITQGSKFNLLQRNLISPFKVVKGDDIEELFFLNEGDSHVQDHPCIKRSDDDESGGSSILDEQSPQGLRDTLQRMKVIQPKFQPKQSQSSQPKFSMASFMQGEDPYDYPTPDDEFDSLQQFRHRSKKPNTITSHNSQKSLVPPIQRKGRPFITNIPKHQNFSPNNIKVIDNRGYSMHNRSYSCEKPQTAILIKKLRALVTECSRNLVAIGPSQFVQWKIEQFRYNIIQQCLKANKEFFMKEMSVDLLLNNQVIQLNKNFESLKQRIQPPTQVDLLRDFDLLY